MITKWLQAHAGVQIVIHMIFIFPVLHCLVVKALAIVLVQWIVTNQSFVQCEFQFLSLVCAM